ncbi:hypothetical protein E4T56_gene9618 [Termitomyces sp. T112]|nr:hypothetical protein E4T56_gene9618 [Termitomyces sp. T112]
MSKSLAFAEGELQDWGIDRNNEDTIDIGNRYLTPIKDVQVDETHIPFKKDIDPFGTLAKMVKAGYIRTADNVVNYMKKRTGTDGKARLEPFAPKAFERGTLYLAKCPS